MRVDFFFHPADTSNALEIHDPTLLWSGALDVGKKANIQGGRDLEARRIEVGEVGCNVWDVSGWDMEAC